MVVVLYRKVTTSDDSNFYPRRRSSSALISEPNHAGSQHHVLHSSGIRRAGGGVNESEFKKRDSKYTRASVVMVVIFVVCNTPRVVPNIMEMIFGQEWFLDTEKCPQVCIL